MRESVSQPKHGWLVVVAVIGIAVAYFALLGSSEFEDPGDNLVYDLTAFEELDDVPSPFAEVNTITLGAEDPRALTTTSGSTLVGAKDVVIVFDENGQETARHAIAGTPTCLAVDDDGAIFAGLRDKVEVLNPDGSSRATWTEFNSRSYFTSIAVNGDGVYLAGAGNRVVYRLGLDGKIQTRIGEKDPARDVPGLEVPSPYLDLALNPDDELWVVNPGELGLEQYRPDGSIVTSWYKPTVLALDGFPGCCNPTHIAFDSKGKLYATEKGMVRVKEFEVTAGTFDALVAPSEAFPMEQSLRDIAIDSQDRVLLLDAKKNAIRVFARKEASDGTTT